MYRRDQSLEGSVSIAGSIVFKCHERMTPKSIRKPRGAVEQVEKYGTSA
jgi:hypothetical protein